MKFGIDVRRAWNLRVPSDAHRSGELTLPPEPHLAQRHRRPGSGDIPDWRCHQAQEVRQPEYRRGRAAVAALLLRAGHLARDRQVHAQLRLAARCHQPADDQRSRKRGYLDLTTGEINVAGVGGISLNGDIENKLNWAPRVGATYQINQKTVIRGGYGRSYDMGVFGSLFGHSVTQNLPVLSVQDQSGTGRISTRLQSPQRAAPPVFPRTRHGRFPLPNNVFARALPTSSGRRPSTPSTSSCNGS